ncbi:OmpA family protein [Exilibacterium tricleocarpae]|uniref:OmpA family protein n=1 Tax=Exilibacterium tricleocarpae TaxID=2591008 RepID=A0A545U5S4_9GAMM|nr:OmpA family protein [Exilibacterium tricleocarpae]TQV84753.1 OmpA family protein [Exilibacterium tricleocarpae]
MLAADAAGVTYKPRPNEAQWQVEASVFECRLSQPIPYYGEGVFLRRAGEQSHFLLRSKSSRLKTGQARLQAKTPVWKPVADARKLGLVPVKQGRVPVTLKRVLAEQMLAELHRGMEVVFTRAPWYGGRESVDVGLTPVNFALAYAKYLDCLTGLLPVNYDQVARTAIYFPSGRDELRPTETRKLDRVALYIQADPAVVAYVIDGHTDSVGRRSDNLELSRMRAEGVARYLIGKGVDREKIATRWHGERYPVSTNRDRKSRAKNRRVTIRLDKGELELPST